MIKNWIGLTLIFLYVFNTCGTPILRHASRKFSTFRRHLAMVSLGCRWHAEKSLTNTGDDLWHQSRDIWLVLTTAGEGTWMLGTDRGRTWLARWHSTTPSVRAAPRSLGKDNLRRASMFWNITQEHRTHHMSSRQSDIVLMSVLI